MFMEFDNYAINLEMCGEAEMFVDFLLLKNYTIINWHSSNESANK